MVQQNIDYSYYGDNTTELPRKKRECTDIICAFVFLLVIFAGLSTGIYGLANGDLNRIAQPYDSDGNACGKGDFQNHKLLFFNNPKDKDLTKNNICVSACPKSSSEQIDCKPNSTFKR